MWWGRLVVVGWVAAVAAASGSQGTEATSTDGADAALVVVAPAPAFGLEDLARTQRWEQLLAVARLRSRQLPLRPEEAMLAATAARRVGDRAAEKLFLHQVSEGGGTLTQVAQVELARLVVDTEPERAVALAMPASRKAVSPQLRAAAVGVHVRGLERGVDDARRGELDQLRWRLPRSLRRDLELALALSHSTESRARLNQLLAGSVADLAALDAARALVDESGLTPVEQWRVGETLYRHALYAEAVPFFEGLVDKQDRSIPPWKVAFLRGRCAFRLGGWQEAEGWYRKALPTARSREGAAQLEVHLARTLELGGDLEGAISAAIRAVRQRTTDERRLFLARLRLRQGRTDLANQGLAGVRGRTARERGRLMLALYELGQGDQEEEAAQRLDRIRYRPWYGPASVLSAQLAADRSDWAAVVSRLDRGVSAMDPYWAHSAREVMARLPAEVYQAWRARCEEELSTLSGRARRAVLQRWAVLESDHVAMAKIRAAAQAEIKLGDVNVTPTFRSTLAGTLWGMGLEHEAARWNPGGMPRSDATETTWSANAFLDLSSPSRAIRTADTAWRMAAPNLPIRALSDSLQKPLHPLPYPDLVRRAAARADVPWPLLAALAREESRWDPEAVSVVGARGLTQLMPATACDVAARLGEPAPNPDALFDPALGLRFGAAELGRLMRVFDGRQAAALAAYNAGEAQARQWLQACGSGCTEERYVLSITFTVTRSYTTAVLAASCAYAELYGSEMNGDDCEPGEEVEGWKVEGWKVEG